MKRDLSYLRKQCTTCVRRNKSCVNRSKMHIKNRHTQFGLFTVTCGNYAKNYK